jgi:hypothetical protein
MSVMLEIETKINVHSVTVNGESVDSFEVHLDNDGDLIVEAVLGDEEDRAIDFLQREGYIITQG